MSYPGNSTLPAAVKDRVVSTFQQTLALYKQGRADEVMAGCNLLLQMDPNFDPARKLLEKIRNPGAPIDVDALLPVERDTRAPIQQAREAMAARDFERVAHLTSQILTDDLLNDEARVLGDEAREKLEAAPFVEQFARKADANLTSGNVAAAKMELEKARSLDPTHPDVVRVARAIEARGSAPAPAAPVPAFIVDSPAPGGRSTAQAADFGFTFEEEKAPEVSFSDFSFNAPAATDFSFDPTPAAPASGGGTEFDFTTASVSTTDDDQKKIEQYLSDGDRAFDAGEYSQAIDLWSRIFLIDVTNDQASDRIERAKARRRELEQKAETILASGIEAFDRGDTAKAHAELTEVLRLDPRNAQAQEYLNRLSETVAPAPSLAPPSEEKLDLFDDELPSGFEMPLVPPDPAAAPAPVGAPAAKSGKQKAAAAPRPTTSPARKRPLGLIVGLLVLVAAAGGWFAWSRMSSDEAEVQAADPGAGAALYGRASLLAGKGDYDRAIALLRDIKPGDPQHEKAMLLIADLQQKKSGAAQLIDGMPAAQYYDQRIAAAGTAFAAGDFIAAKAAFEQAMRVKPLPPELKTQYEAATQQASKLDAAKALFAERKYTEAIANLQPLLQAEPQNAGIRRMLADAHFNLAAMALQEERTADALRELDETLKLNPNDELARRSRELAQRYNNEPKDLLYRIYVKYLPLRAG
ncbi:MAG TPA: tetratricopeptide repeat protein [Thermoanaerobaculia bacterium]|nr:tetratricopeptide repeat protein [Thermoanaerobaculia bacterium]